MNFQELREFCLSLPGATEDVKWVKDLCFCIAKKMFCVTGFDPGSSVSLKVRDEEFAEHCERPGVEPAPYVGRYKWIAVDSLDRFSDAEWKKLIRQSHALIVAKLPVKDRPTKA